MYKVVKYFTDMQDENHEYKVGDKYPRDGKEVSEARIEALLGNTNRQKTPLIEKVDGAKEDKPKAESLNTATLAQSEEAEQEASPSKAKSRKVKKDEE